jgi:cytochrome c oxidase subunit 3/cytochrome o ubiquinol oxidase subunit 3
MPDEAPVNELTAPPPPAEAGISPGAAQPLPIPPPIAPERTLTAAQWGMVAFLASEVALFSTLIVTYLFYLGKDRVSPTPAEALRLSLVLFTTACLLTSSVTVHLAVTGIRNGHEPTPDDGDAVGRTPHAAFFLWWLATIALGVIFLAGTAYEWHDLIVRERLTISRNLFGTTYYTVVGLHALHVTVGVILLGLTLALVLRRHITTANEPAVELVSWYWHFVDVVWIVVFTVVYVIGR